MIPGAEVYTDRVSVAEYVLADERLREYADLEIYDLRQRVIREAVAKIQDGQAAVLQIERHDFPDLTTRSRCTVFDVGIKQIVPDSDYRPMRLAERPVFMPRPTVRQRVRGFFRDRWREACEAADSCRSDRP